MDTALDSLNSSFKPFAVAWLARLTEARVPVIISNTRRTAAEQTAAVARGVSWVQHSLHEDGLAMDVVPFAQFVLHGLNKLQWDTSDPVWLKVRDAGVRAAQDVGIGVRWGGTFTPLNQLGIGKDPGHMEFAMTSTTGVHA